MELCVYIGIVGILVILLIALGVFCNRKQTIKIDEFIDNYEHNEEKNTDINNIVGKDWIDVIGVPSKRFPISIDQSYRWYDTQ